MQDFLPKCVSLDANGLDKARVVVAMQQLEHDVVNDPFLSAWYAGVELVVVFQKGWEQRQVPDGVGVRPVRSGRDAELGAYVRGGAQ